MLALKHVQKYKLGNFAAKHNNLRKQIVLN